MTNLKKTLAVVLAFAMILSMGAISTFAYTDVAEGTIVSEAVDILSGLNILTGFEDGTFRPDETVTRAQMAAIICRTLGYEDQAQSSMGTTIFNDVAADHWASGYINVAQAQQIINGYGDGNYGPEDKVTYEQAVKMIVSALGYDIAAQAKGGYPTGYLAIASAEGITKSANGKVGDAAARSTIAVLVYNSLEVRLMDQNTWSTDGTDTYGKDNKNILTNYLDVVKVEGIVTDNALTDVAGYTYKADADSNVTIDGYGWIFEDYSAESYSAYKKVALSSVDALDGKSEFDASRVDVTDLIGKYVVAYIGEDEVTGKNTVFAIAESKSKNDTIKISAKQLVDSGKYYELAGFVGYTEVGSSKAIDLTLDSEVLVYKNFDEASANTTKALANLATNGGIVEFISNDADSEIECILVTSYDKEAVIEEVEEINGVYTYETFTGTDELEKIDVEDEDKLFVVYKDGVAATAADLAVNDTVSCVKVAKNFWIYYASSATVTGVVDAYDTEDNTVTIAGTDYEISDARADITPKKLSGEEGIYFLNVDGQIAHNETAPTSVGKYALVLASYEEEIAGSASKYITAVLADGTVAQYEIYKSAKVEEYDGDPVDSVTPADSDDVIDTDDEFAEYFEQWLTAADNTATAKKAKAANITGTNGLLVKLTVNGSGKVTKARQIYGTSGSKTADYDATARSLGSVDFDESAVIFSVKSNPVADAAKAVDADAVKVGTLETFFADEKEYTLIAYDNEDGDFYGAAVGMDLAKAIAVDSSVFVVSGMKTITYNDEEAYSVTGMIDGEEKTIIIYNEDDYNGQNPDKLVAGDVILISEPDAEGVVSDIEQLVDFTKATPATVASVETNVTNNDDEIASAYGLLSDATKTKFYLTGSDADVEYDYDYSDWSGDDEGITYKSANYTLVDFSENYKNPEVSAESSGKNLFDVNYVTYVYVRVVDDKLADVVVYRMEELVALEVYASVEDGEEVEVDDTITFTANVDGADFTITDACTGTAAVTIDGNEVTVDAGDAEDTIEITVEIEKDGFDTEEFVFEYTIAE